MTKQNQNNPKPQFVVKRAIISADRLNKEIDITQNLAELNIFESLNTPYLTGKCAISDDQGLFDALEFQGTEILELEIGASDTDNTTAVLNKRFYMIGIEKQTKANQSASASVFVFDLIDEHGFLGRIQKISKSYTGSLEKIVKSILQNELGRRVDIGYTGAKTSSDELSAQQDITCIIPNLTAIDGQQVTGEVDFAQVANSVAGANVSGTVALATSATSATTSGTVTTSAQPNITSVGTMTVLGVNGIVTAQSFTANTGLFTGDGGGLSNVAAANISGVVANATYATSAGSAALALDITGATQPNITAVGTLTSLTVSGNITNQTHIIKDVTVATAAGTNQSGATALAGADIFTVTTNTNDNGVRLMAATPGLCIFIKNTSGSNTLKVYPASNDAIDGNGTNGAMSIGPLGQIQFVAHSSAQWYTVGATYA